MLDNNSPHTQIYTVSHAAAGGESIAKIELFDLTRHRWKKGSNLRYGQKSETLIIFSQFIFML